MTATPLTAPASENLLRSVPFELVRDGEPEGDGNTFRGYAAVFNQATVIDSWEGRFEEEIAPGAFKRTLRSNTPVFQFDHGSHPMIGSIPLGVITDAREDDRGVFVEAQLHDNWLVQPVRDAIASGAVDGMSFRFEVVRDRWTTADGTLMRNPDEIIAAISQRDGDMPKRTLLELKSREMGPVVFPAYAGTSATVRSVTLDLNNLTDPEQRRTLAQAVLLADMATIDSPDSPDDTPEGLVDHEDREADTPQTTTTAGEHVSKQAAPEGFRDSIRRQRAAWAPTIKHALEGAHRYE